MGPLSDAGRSVEDVLLSELGKVVLFGKNLTTHKCRTELRELQSLTQIAGICAAKLGQSDNSLSPILAHTMIGQSIDRLAMSDPSEQGNNKADARRVLFGLTPGSGPLSGPARRKRALDLYNSSLNPRSEDVTLENFNRKICRTVLLKPLVEELLLWNSELRLTTLTHKHHSDAALDRVAYAWRHTFRWLFDLNKVATDLEDGLKYILHRRTSLYGNGGLTLSTDVQWRLNMAITDIAELREMQPNAPKGVDYRSTHLAKILLSRLPGWLLLGPEELSILDQIGQSGKRSGQIPGKFQPAIDKLTDRGGFGYLRSRILAQMVICTCSENEVPECGIHKFLTMRRKMDFALTDEWMSIAYGTFEIPYDEGLYEA